MSWSPNDGGDQSPWGGDDKKKKLTTQSKKEDYSDIPKQTLKLIEEAEEIK